MIPPRDFFDRSSLQRFVRVELEIGSASGDLLCDLAGWHPHCLFVGVDIDSVFCERAMALVRARGLQNVVVVNDEALRFLALHVPNALLDALHIYHPTPRREGNLARLMTPRFEAEAFRTLRPWGTLRLLTDNEEYFATAVQLFGVKRWWQVNWQRDEFALRRNAFAGSPLEMHYRSWGAHLYHVQLTKLPAAPG